MRAARGCLQFKILFKAHYLVICLDAYYETSPDRDPSLGNSLGLVNKVISGMLGLDSHLLFISACRIPDFDSIL
jgi:hypothetical protein